MIKRKPKPLFYVIILTVLAVILLLMGSVCIYLALPVDRNDDTTIEVEIPKGSSTREIASILKEKDLIRSDTYFSVFTRIFSHKVLKASTYQFTKSMSLTEIVQSLEKGSSYDPDRLVMTFKEGQRLLQYVAIIEKQTTYTEEEILSIINDREFLLSLIEKYWFLTDSILNSSIYYPLEGYLAPDTYFFKKDVNIKTIIETLLDEEEKNLEKYRNYVNEENIHSIFTMASIVELEGTNTENRKEIVGIFQNRISLKMNMGSDVTTYYALQLPLTTDLSSSQFSVINPYNTRASNMGGKLPVGPICSPSISSIEASIFPSDNDYLYFVADKNGKIYYTKTLQEHEQKVAEIKKNGDWIW